jgi:hypothetical protein
LLLAMPIWALQETVTVSAGDTETLPTSVSDGVQAVADALGLTLLGWTPGEIADGQRPATYYGLGATVTPAVETTYYAMFARADGGGELMLRQCASPADGDTVLLVTAVSPDRRYMLRNASTDNMAVDTIHLRYSASILKISDALADRYGWVYLEQENSKFQLRLVNYPTYYLNATAFAVKCSTSEYNRDMQLSGGFMYCPGVSKYLCVTIVSGNLRFAPVASVPDGQTFSFYRKERYVDFATTIGQVPGCDNCFIYVP